MNGGIALYLVSVNGLKDEWQLNLSCFNVVTELFVIIILQMIFDNLRELQ